MEPDKRFQIKLDILKKALDSFKKLMDSNLSLFDEVISDGLKNGQIQKFEYCNELLWKTIKKYLLIYHGIDAKTPKLSIKEFFLAGYINEIIYEELDTMINERNRLSHVYLEEDFKLIHKNLHRYLDTMLQVLEILQYLSKNED
jgi:nucleotidyltransferase substrate binding protein (TIGR01987 family)